MKKRLFSLLLALSAVLSLLCTTAFAAESTGVGITPVTPSIRMPRARPLWSIPTILRSCGSTTRRWAAWRSSRSTPRARRSSFLTPFLKFVRRLTTPWWTPSPPGTPALYSRRLLKGIIMPWSRKVHPDSSWTHPALFFCQGWRGHTGGHSQRSYLRNPAPQGGQHHRRRNPRCLLHSL